MINPEPDIASLSSQTVGEIGRLLASAEMLKRGICVAKPEVDIGVDLISQIGRDTRLIQVKAKIGPNCPSDQRAGSIGSVFSVSSRQPGVKASSSKRYRDIGVDVFVFVRIQDTAFWVVPSDQIKPGWKVTMRDDSPWRNAWHVLTGGGERAA